MTTSLEQQVSDAYVAMVERYGGVISSRGRAYVDESGHWHLSDWVIYGEMVLPDGWGINTQAEQAILSVPGAIEYAESLRPKDT